MLRSGDMAIAKQGRESHDNTAAHGATGASHLGPGKQSLVESIGAGAPGHAGVEAQAASAGGHKGPTKAQLETNAIFQLGAYGQRVKTAFDTVKERVGRSKSVQQAASAALGAAGGLLADKLGEEIGKGLGLVIGKITEKVGESLGEKFPELKGDESAAAYLGKAEEKLHDIIFNEAQDIPNHHTTMVELNKLLTFLASDAASAPSIARYVNQKLNDYQSSVELLLQNPKQLNPIHNELVAGSPVLGRVPDPARGNVPHLAVVQATKQNIPGEPLLTTWALLHFVPAGLGPEANAVMGDKHPGESIPNFKLKVAGHMERGLAPVSS
ncbi:MAG: hypothetical protein ABIY55_33935 [Kofleriaceae bacterium]